MIGVYFSIGSFFVVFILALVFFLKKKTNNLETKTYSYLLITTLLILILEIVTCFWYKNSNPTASLIYQMVCKLTFSSYVIWAGLQCIYILNASEENKKTKFFFMILLIISIVCIFLLPVEFKNTDNGKITPSGLSTAFCYFTVLLFILINIVYSFKNLKILSIKKVTPIFLTIIFTIIVFLISIAYPELFLIGYELSLIILIMYFTIENPDAKLVEYEKTEKERAEAASLAKSEFLSSMSHELRTPLNAIVGLSEDIESFKEKVPAEVREDTKDIINASNTLLEIIGSILDISKIESGKLDIVQSDYDPREEFESVAKINRTKFVEKNLEFNVKISENLPEVLYGDRIRIKQILNNFLSNAYKYTDGGHVDFTVNWLDASSSLQLIVKDTGRGVKPEDIDKLFAKYDRLGVEKTSNVQGTGLGLNITKTLIDLMGGTVKVDSEYMVGSTFTVLLPQKLGNKEELDRIRKENSKVVEKLDYTGKRLLVADDNMLNIKVLKKAIREFNFIIDECYNGKEAIEKIELNNNYDLVLLDIKMPIMSGDEAIKYIRNMSNFNCPVVALTADAMTGAKEKYQQMGFDDYLSKPFTRDAMAKKLSSILGNGKDDKPKPKNTKKDNLENTAVINVENVNVTVNNIDIGKE